MNRNNITLVISAARTDQFIADPLPQIAFSGRSNVGKSSALNKILNRKSLARVSSTPGKTVTLNFFNIDDKCYFVDLPGYGFANRSKEEQKVWLKLTDSYFQNNERLRLVIQLIDSKTGPSKDDLTMLNWLAETGTPFVVLATKWDKLNQSAKQKSLEEIRGAAGEGVEVFPISSRTGFGAAEVWAYLEKLVEGIG